MSTPLNPNGYGMAPSDVQGVQRIVDEMGRLGLIQAAVGAAAFSALTGNPTDSAALANALALKISTGGLKTVNGNSLEGSGNLVISGSGGGSPTLVSSTDVIPLGTVDPGVYMARQVVTANKTVTRGTVTNFGACVSFYVMDGTHTIDLTPFAIVAGSNLVTSGIFTGSANHLYSLQFAVIDSVPSVGVVDLGLIDAIAPTLSAAAVPSGTATRINLTWSEAIDSTSIPAVTAFAINAGHPLTDHTYVDSTHTYLTTSTPFIGGEAARTLSYTVPGTNPIKDLAGNSAISFSGFAITNGVLAAARADNLSSTDFSTSDGGSPWTIALGTPTKVSGHFTRTTGVRGIVALETSRLLQDQTWTINPGVLAAGVADFNQLFYRFTDVNNNIFVAFDAANSRMQVGIAIGGSQVVATNGTGYTLNASVNNSIRGYFTDVNTFKVDINGVNVPSLTTDVTSYNSTLTSTKIAWFMTELEPQVTVFSALT